MREAGQWPLPDCYDPSAVGSIWRVPYEVRAAEARAFAALNDIGPAAGDRPRIAVLAVDMQNTFCSPGFELFVAGRSGMGAVDDSRRFVEFLYRNLGRVSRVYSTIDTHQAAQIFHALFLVDEHGDPPPAMTFVSVEDVERGRWRFNESLSEALSLAPGQGQSHLLNYTKALRDGGKYALTIWPYHSMLGGIGHALVPSVEEAFFFHSVARSTPVDYRVKGYQALTEAYSVFGPEVERGPSGEVLGQRDEQLVEQLLRYDHLLVAGQAKSHCVAWSVADLLDSMSHRDPALAGRLYLLEDCTSSVVVPGADFSDEGDAAFARFAQAGAHVVRSTTPMDEWPGIGL